MFTDFFKFLRTQGTIYTFQMFPEGKTKYGYI